MIHVYVVARFMNQCTVCSELHCGVTNSSHSLLQVCKYDIEQSIKREMSGDLEDGMLAIGWLVTTVVFVTKS